MISSLFLCIRPKGTMQPLSSKEKSGQSRGKTWRSISGSSETSTTRTGSEEAAVGFVAAGTEWHAAIFYGLRCRFDQCELLVWSSERWRLEVDKAVVTLVVAGRMCAIQEGWSRYVLGTTPRVRRTLANCILFCYWGQLIRTTGMFGKPANLAGKTF